MPMNLGLALNEVHSRSLEKLMLLLAMLHACQSSAFRDSLTALKA